MSRRALLLALLLVGCGGDESTVVVEPASPESRARSAALSARVRHADDLRHVSAHRGGPTPGYPENCLATFERAASLGPVWIECDVRRTADGVLVLLHDETLDRTTTGAGRLDRTAWREVEALSLVDPEGAPTGHRVPTLDEALDWSKGRTVLSLDVKDGVPPAEVVAAVRGAAAEDRAIVIVSTVASLETFRRLAPDLVYSISIGSRAELRQVLETGAEPDRLIAFLGTGPIDGRLVDDLHGLGIRTIYGTFRRIDEAARRGGPSAFDPVLDAGIDVIATDAVAEAVEAIAGRTVGAR